MLVRAFSIRAAEQKSDDGAVALSFSSGRPVQRQTWGGMWWNEVLGHNAGEVRTERLEQGLTLLVNHDPNQRAGRLENGRIDGEEGRGDALFGTTDFARTTKQEVDDKTLRYVSVGYIVHNVERVQDDDPEDDKDEDYLGTYRVTDWEPVEVSLVSVPADPSVGVGRSQGAQQYPVAGLMARSISKPAPAVTSEVESMATTAVVPSPEELRSQVSTEVRGQIVANVRGLDALHTQYPEVFTAEKRSQFIAENKTVAEANEFVLGELSSRNSKNQPAPSAPLAEIVESANDKRDKGTNFARAIRAIAATRGQGMRAAAQFAEETLKDQVVARALAAGQATSGGFLVPESWAGEVIELLRPATVVRSLNPTIVPMPNGTYGGPKLTQGATASYIGELKPLPKTEQAFGGVKMSAKKLAAMVPISNDLLRFNTYNADTLVRQDTLAAISQAEDISFIRSTGGQYSPKGLRWLVPSANVLPANGTVNLDNVTNDLGKLKLALKKGNSRMLRPGIIMGVTAEYYLENLRDGNGNFAFRAEMATGKIAGIPYKTTTQIPENLGGDGDESEILLADFADVLIGEVPGMVIETSSEATYTDGSGNKISAYENDLTLLKVIMQHDIATRHDESLAVLTGVTWGA